MNYVNYLWTETLLLVDDVASFRPPFLPQKIALETTKKSRNVKQFS